MLVYVLIGSIIVAAISIGISIRNRWSYKRSRKHSRELRNAAHDADYKWYRDLINSAKNPDFIEAKQELIDVWTASHSIIRNDFPEIYQEFQRLLSQCMRDVRVAEILPDLQQQYLVVTTSEDVSKQLDALATMLGIYTFESQKNLGIPALLNEQVGIDLESLKVLLLSTLQSFVDSLASEATTNYDSFITLRNIRYETFLFKNRKFSFVEDDLHWPANWNDLVALHIKVPTYNEFVGTRSPRDLEVGNVRMMAAEAERMSNFTQAKIALAYCNANTKTRDEVGAWLTARLAKIIAIQEAANKERALRDETDEN